jgi:ABC-type Fe3+ transport system permease subunit
MHRSEIKTIQPASAFALLFSAVFIVGLVYLLAANLKLLPHYPTLLMKSLEERLDLLTPIPKSLAYAFIAGLVTGVLGMALALVYNVFAGIMGGIKAEIKD